MRETHGYYCLIKLIYFLIDSSNGPLTNFVNSETAHVGKKKEEEILLQDTGTLFDGQ